MITTGWSSTMRVTAGKRPSRWYYEILAALILPPMMLAVLVMELKGSRASAIFRGRRSEDG